MTSIKFLTDIKSYYFFRSYSIIVSMYGIHIYQPDMYYCATILKIG